MRILVANRGEIARRIQRTARELGHETVAVYADPDRHAPFVREADRALRIGPAALDASYLDRSRMLDAAKRTGATAVHPGYGFLSENAAFARDVEAARLVWIGPHADAIARMGSKIEARGLADAAGVPTIPGFDDSQDPGDLADAARRIGFPVLVKAAAGGGGKGIRIVRAPGDFATALGEATREAQRSFGSADVIVERFIERARHVEVQVVGDRHGNVIDLGTRECSVQRRYQKLLEEAPAPNLPDATRAGLCESARALALAIGYDSAGTVEFVVDDDSGAFFFLEMNTRLQVEHPVTEAITGLDLVALQIRCAEGLPLPLAQNAVRFHGHAFEARINAEDAAAGFVPRTGRVIHLHVPDGVRFDTGIETGSEVTPHYDAMLAKLVCHGPDRDTARRRLVRALRELRIGGVVTNAGFQRWLLEQPELVAGRVTTRFLEQAALPGAPDEETAARVAAEVWRAAQQRSAGATPWSALREFRLTPHRPDRRIALRDGSDHVHEVEVSDSASAGERPPAGAALVAERQVVVNRDGHSHTFRVLTRSERWARSPAEGLDAAETTRAPFPAVVTETPVAAGDAVAAGDVVVVIEAMKMLHSLVARGAGVVHEVHVAVGDSVEGEQVLVSYENTGPDETGPEGER